MAGEHPGRASARHCSVGGCGCHGTAHRRFVTSPATGPVTGGKPGRRVRRMRAGRDRRRRRRGAAGGGGGEGCGDAVSGVTHEAENRPRAGSVSQQRTGAGRRVSGAARPARVHHRGSLLAAGRRGHRTAESAHGRSRVMAAAVGGGNGPPPAIGPDRHAPHGEHAAAAARLGRDGGHAAFLRLWGPPLNRPRGRCERGRIGGSGVVTVASATRGRKRSEIAS